MERTRMGSLVPGRAWIISSARTIRRPACSSPTPTTRAALLETVARLYRLRVYWGQCRADFAIASRLAELATNHDPAVDGPAREYQELRHRLTAVRSGISETSRDFEPRDVARAYARIDRLGVPHPA